MNTAMNDAASAAATIFAELDRNQREALRLAVSAGADGAAMLAYDVAFRILEREPDIVTVSALLARARARDDANREALLAAAADDRAADWARYYRLRRSTASLGARGACLGPLMRQRCRAQCGNPCPYCASFADHTTLWRGRDGLLVWVAQPYQFTASDALELSALAQRLTIQTAALPPGHGWYVRSTFWIVASNRLIPPHAYRYDDAMLRDPDKLVCVPVPKEMPRVS